MVYILPKSIIFHSYLSISLSCYCILVFLNTRTPLISTQPHHDLFCKIIFLFPKGNFYFHCSVSQLLSCYNSSNICSSQYIWKKFVTPLSLWYTYTCKCFKHHPYFSYRSLAFSPGLTFFLVQPRMPSQWLASILWGHTSSTLVTQLVLDKPSNIFSLFLHTEQC